MAEYIVEISTAAPTYQVEICVATTSGVTSHPLLTERDNADQHPIGAITGLQTELDGKANRLIEFKTAQITGDYTIIADDISKECVINTPTDIDITVGSAIPIGGSVFFRIVGAGLPAFIGTASQDITVPDLADRTFIELYRQEDDSVTGNQKYEVV